MNKILNIAHRGASGHVQENTIEAITKAIELGADMIEIDVHQTKDNKLIVLHDSFIITPFKHKRYIKKISFQSLKAWNLQVPLLEDVLEVVKGKIRLNIEIKRGVLYYPGVEMRVLDLLNRFDMINEVLISSFNFETLKAIREMNKEISLGFLLEKEDKKDLITESRLINVSVLGISKWIGFQDLINYAHHNELKVYVYTLDREDEMRLFIQRGVDGIFTNFPDVLDKLNN